MSRVVDRFLVLKEPEAIERLRDAAEQAVAGLEIDADPESAEQRLRAHKRSLLAEYDDAILQAVGMTVDDLIHLVETRAKRQHESGTGPGARHADALDTALRSFIVSEIERHDHAQAIAAALDAIAYEHTDHPNERTVANWLAELHTWNVTSIPRPR